MIQRFPRYPPIMRFPRFGKLTKTEKMRQKLAKGETVRGYGDKPLTKKQWIVIREISRGEPVSAACNKAETKTETFYRWLQLSPRFARALATKVNKAAEHLQQAIARHLVRAIRVIDETLDSPDAGLAYTAGRDVLRGVGAWKTNVSTRTEVAGTIKLESKVEPQGLNDQMMMMLVQGLVRAAQGKPAVVEIPTKDVKVLSSGNPEEEEGKDTQTPGGSE